MSLKRRDSTSCASLAEPSERPVTRPHHHLIGIGDNELMIELLMEQISRELHTLERPTGRVVDFYDMRAHFWKKPAEVSTDLVHFLCNEDQLVETEAEVLDRMNEHRVAIRLHGNQHLRMRRALIARALACHRDDY